VGRQADFHMISNAGMEIICQHNVHILLIRNLAGPLGFTMGARRIPPEQNRRPAVENFFNDTFFS